MQLWSNSSRARVLAVVAAVSLTWGIVFAPQVALAEEDIIQEGVEQVAVASDTNDEQAVLTESDTDTTVTETTAPETTSEAEATEVVEGEASEEIAEGEGQETDTEEAVSEGNVSGTEEAASEEADSEDVAESDGEAATTTEVAEDQVEEETTTGTIETATADDSTLSSQGDPEYQTIEDGTYYIESGIAASDGAGLAKLVLDARNGATEGTDVIVWNWSSSGKDNQKWIVMRDGTSDWYNIASFADTSLYLTAVADNKIYLTKYVSGLASQLWAFVLSGTSYGTGYQMVSQGVQKSVTDTEIVATYQDKAVDVKGGKPVKGSAAILYAKGDATKANQCFYLAKMTPDEVTGGVKDVEGRYSVRVPGTTIVVEARGASSDNGTNISVYNDKGGAHQSIYLQHEGNGFYSVWIMGTKKVLDVANSCILPGANVIQWTYTKGKKNQQWAVYKNDDGTYTFVNRATGLALGGASEKSGKYGSSTNLAGAQNNGRVNNTFTLKRYALLTPGIYKFTKSSNGLVVDVKGGSSSSGATLGFYKDKGSTGSLNQRFELVSTDTTDHMRIRTAASGGWVTVNSSNKVVQQGNHATAQTDSNTWLVTWNNGYYQFSSINNNHYLGGVSATYKMNKTPIGYTGLIEIDSMAAAVSLDNPKSSTDYDTKYGVYPSKHSANQRYLIEKSGSGYKITNIASGLVLTASGEYVVQKKFTGAASQIWTFAIADGGAVRIVNSSNNKVLDIYGTGSVSTSGTTGARLYASNGDREARQGWKMNITTGWYKFNGHWRYASLDSRAHFDNNVRENGTDTGNYDIMHEIWSKVQKNTSKTKYMIVSAWDACYVGVFTGSYNNWQPLFGWNCVNMSRDIINEYYYGSAPTYSKLLALGNNNKSILEDDVDGWVWGLDTTWAGSRRRMISSAEQYFTSIEFWLGYHTYLSSTNELGKHLSHGCIRLDYPNAKWIYDTIAPGTRCLQIRSSAV